jgi:hypothetical protein
MKLSCQKSMNMIAKALEKISQLEEVKFDEQFKLVLLKNKEKLMEKSNFNFFNERSGDVKVF